MDDATKRIRPVEVELASEDADLLRYFGQQSLLEQARHEGALQMLQKVGSDRVLELARKHGMPDGDVEFLPELGIIRMCLSQPVGIPRVFGQPVEEQDDGDSEPDIGRDEGLAAASGG